MLELAVVLLLVVVPLGARDETVVGERPLLEARDPNPLAGAARPGVRPGEDAVELDRVSLECDVVDEHLDVRERSKEPARDVGDLRRLAAVDRDRPSWDEVTGNLCRIVAAPRVCVAACEVPHARLIERHLASCRRHIDLTSGRARTLCCAHEMSNVVLVVRYAPTKSFPRIDWTRRTNIAKRSFSSATGVGANTVRDVSR